MHSRRHDHTPLILIVAVFLFISPFTSWWSSLTLPWYAIFLPWSLVIGLIGLNQYWRDHDDD